MAGEPLRRALPSDWPAIERLLVAAELPLHGAREILPHFVIAERGGEIVACAALEPYGEAALLRSVAVRDSERGSGLGAALVRKLLDEPDTPPTVILLTTTAAGWFPRFGFRRIEASEVPPSVLQSVEFRGACPSTAVVMSLRRNPM